MSHENRPRRAPGSGSDGAGHENLSTPVSGSGGDDRLAAVLELGRSLLDAEFGAVVRLDGERGEIRATVGELPTAVDPVSGLAERCADALSRDGTVTIPVATLADTGESGGWFVGRELPGETGPTGVLCFVGRPPREAFDESVEHDVESLARLATESGHGGGWVAQDWDDTAFNETLLDTVHDVLYAFTLTGRPVQWNDRLEAVTGYDTSTVSTMEPLDFVAETDREAVVATIEELKRGEIAVAEARLETADGEWIPYEFRSAPVTDDGEVVGFVGVGRDVSAHREYEETLAALHDTTRELLPVETETEIAERVLAAVDEILGIELAAVYLFDRSANTLDPVAETPGSDGLVDEIPAFGPDDGLVWDAFMRGDVAVFDDVTDLERVDDREVPVRSVLLVPVGEHGLIVAADTAAGVFDDRTAEVVDTLAANAEAALDNVARKRELADRDETLERQHRRLDRLNDVNERVRRIGHDIVGVDVREEIKRVVVERLVDSDLFEFAWIGARSNDGMTVRASAGRGEGYVEAVRGEPDPDDPVWRTAETGDPTVVDRVADGFRSEGWRSEALHRDFQSALAVPLVHDGVPHGVLGLYAGGPDVVDEEMLAVFRELGEMVGQAVAAAKRHRAQSTDERIELVVRMSECPLAPFAVALGCGVTLTGAVSRADDRTLLYGTTSADAASFECAVERAPGVADGRVVATEGEGVRFELTTERASTADTVRAFGGDLVGVELDGEGTRLVARLPADADVRTFVASLESRFGAAEVLAQRSDPEPTGTAPLDALTDRQCEALLAAYHAGFFEWPRESDGSTVAADLGISQPTFVEHLRRAESNLLDSLLGTPD